MDSVTIMLIPDKTYRDARPKTKEHHLTVAYFGKLSDLGVAGVRRLRMTVEGIAAHAGGPIAAKANGIGVFRNGDEYALVDLIDGIGTFQTRAKVENVYGGTGTGIRVDYTHGFTPHITREYLSADDDFYAVAHGDLIDGIEFTFEAIGLWAGDTKYEVSL